MAGSFEIFRKYQRGLLVCVAILSMLAFFVLPPFLQMGGPSGGQDTWAVSWRGGGFRESDLERTVALRSLVNRFLAEAAAAGGRDPSRLPLLPEGEEQAVQTALLAQEARDNGLVVSDQAINDFLGQWTGNVVRQDQLDAIIARLRLGPLPLTEQDLFSALRVELAARAMLLMHQSALSAAPPGWKWDYFRRLEQRATVEVVPVVAERLGTTVSAPSESALRGFYASFKDKLPEARSADPGFREPHRIRYDFLVAKRGLFEEEESKAVTAEQIADFYEKNKTTMFRARPKTPEDKPGAEDKKDADGAPVEKTSSPPADGENKPSPADGKPAPAGGEPAPSAAPPKPDGAAIPSSPSSAVGGRRFEFASFRQPADAEPEAGGGDAAKATPDAPGAGSAKPAESQAAAEKQPSTKEEASKAAAAKTEDPAAAAVSKPAEPKPDAPSPEAKAEEPQLEPLENVREEIRSRLARERADARIDAIFTAVAGDLARYSEDYALWQARRLSGVEPPSPPDPAVIAEKQGLASGHSDLVSADSAIAAGGIAGSFEFIPDPTSRFGIRQQRWLDQMFGAGAQSLRPVRSRDVEGNRYLSWRIEDQPEFTPSFETARTVVDQAWRLVEARGPARRLAEEIARTATEKRQSLAASLPAAGGGDAALEAFEVGPFSWLDPSSTAGGGMPSLAQPDLLSMPGDEFMRSVFALEPGQTAVAFNEPRTVCYAIRVVTLEPSTDELRTRFLDRRGDRQAVAMVAQREASATFRGLVEGMEKRYGLEWKRQPRGGGR